MHRLQVAPRAGSTPLCQNLAVTSRPGHSPLPVFVPFWTPRVVSHPTLCDCCCHAPPSPPLKRRRLPSPSHQRALPPLPIAPPYVLRCAGFSCHGRHGLQRRRPAHARPPGLPSRSLHIGTVAAATAIRQRPPPHLGNRLRAAPRLRLHHVGWRQRWGWCRRRWSEQARICSGDAVGVALRACAAATASAAWVCHGHLPADGGGLLGWRPPRLALLTTASVGGGVALRVGRLAGQSVTLWGAAPLGWPTALRSAAHVGRPTALWCATHRWRPAALRANHVGRPAALRADPPRVGRPIAACRGVWGPCGRVWGAVAVALWAVRGNPPPVLPPNVWVRVVVWRAPAALLLPPSWRLAYLFVRGGRLRAATGAAGAVGTAGPATLQLRPLPGLRPAAAAPPWSFFGASVPAVPLWSAAAAVVPCRRERRVPSRASR